MSVHSVPAIALLIASVGFPIWQEKEPAASVGNLYAVAVDNLTKWLAPDAGAAAPVVEIDPRVLGPRGRGMPLMSTDLHPPAALAGVARDKTIVVMTLARAQQCTGAGAQSCRTQGRFVAIAFDAAVLNGAEATVTAFVRVSRAPTAAELARLQQSNNPSALTRFANEAGSATLFRLTLARRDGEWTVIRREIIGQS